MLMFGDQLSVLRSREALALFHVSHILPVGEPEHVLMMKQKLFIHLSIYLLGLLRARQCNKEPKK